MNPAPVTSGAAYPTSPKMIQVSEKKTNGAQITNASPAISTTIDAPA
jgi:hypothetical protein